MINEDEHQNIHNILVNPSKVLIDPLQTGIRPDGQVTFTCHMKRGSADTNAKIKYDKVKFTGYFREFISHIILSAYKKKVSKRKSNSHLVVRIC